MSSQDYSGTLYPPSTIQDNFIGGSKLSIYTGPKTLSSTESLQDTVTNPLCSVIIQSSVTGEYLQILNLISVRTINSINYNMPMSELLFVLGPDETPPAIGPMDVIAIWMLDKSGQYKVGINVPSPDSLETQNRIFTGIVHEYHETWSAQYGQAYRVVFTTNIKKFDITTEFRDLSYLSTASGDFQVPTAVAASISSLEAPPGEFIRKACAQSNVKFAYIFDPITTLFDGTTGNQLQNTAPNQSAKYSAQFNGFINYGVVSNGEDGLYLDSYKNIIEFQRLNWKSNLLHWFNPIDHVFQTWLRILADVIDGAFLELFFSRYGLLYARNIGMFVPSHFWNFSIEPSVILEYDDYENDDNIITRLQLNWDTAQSNLNFEPYVWGPPNQKQLERLYGPRYKIVQAPWAVYTLAAPSSPNALPSRSILFDYLRDYATLYMATMNANAVRGTCTLLGFADFEVGQTVYFPHKDRVFYITDVVHDIVAGDKWTTTLHLTYGRPSAADFLNYINARAVALGLQNSSGDDTSGNGPTGNSVVTTSGVNNSIPVGSGIGSIAGFDSDFPQLNNIINPVQGFGTQGYGYDASNDPYQNPHVGDDYLVPVGTQIYAVQDGSVVFANFTNIDSSFGYMVQINSSTIPNCPPFECIYAHMSQVQVNVGQNVSKGQVIGLSGSTGASNAPHLHIQVQQPGSLGVSLPINRTANPSKIALAPGASSQPTFVDTVSSASGNMVANDPPFIGDDGNLHVTWRDVGFKDDVVEFAKELLGALNVPAGTSAITYICAQAAQEVANGNQFRGRWNYLNIGNFGTNFVDYGSVSEAASKTATAILNWGGNRIAMQTFLNYLASPPPDGFDPVQAASIQYQQAGWGTAAETVANIAANFFAMVAGKYRWSS